MESPDTIGRLLGQRIRTWRIAIGYSQEELAEHSGLHRTYIGTVERGEQNITIKNAAKIAQALGVSLSDILGAQHLKELYEVFPGTFSIMNAKGELIAWNDYMRDKVVGLPEEKMYGTDGMATVHPEDRAYTIEEFSIVLRTGEQRTGEARILSKGGPSYVWRSITGRRIYVEGEPCVLAIGIDITDPKQSNAIELLSKKLFTVDESASIEELLQVSLDAAERVTGSSSGFCAFIAGQPANLPPQIWSMSTMDILNAAGVKHDDLHLRHVPEVWSDVILKQSPVIHNDVASVRKEIEIPYPIQRELLIPLEKNGTIAALFVLTNKSLPYTDNDQSIAERIAYLIWSIISRKIAE